MTQKDRISNRLYSIVITNVMGVYRKNAQGVVARVFRIKRLLLLGGRFGAAKRMLLAVNVSGQTAESLVAT